MEHTTVILISLVIVHNQLTVIFVGTDLIMVVNTQHCKYYYKVIDISANRQATISVSLPL